MLRITVPSYFQEEINWISNVLFTEMLGIPFRLERCESYNFTIYQANRSLTLADSFFSNSFDKWLSSATLPQLPLTRWDISTSNLNANLIDNAIPVLFGQPGFHTDELGNGHLSLDVFGSAFFMLSRYEEVVVPERDSHDRFPATASIAFKANFLDRPIVDEYVEILWGAMTRLWPALKRKSRKGQVFVTCDVDEPYERGILSPSSLARDVVKAIIHQHSLKIAVNKFRNVLASRNGCYQFDQNWTFDWYMDTCEQFGRRASFFFIAIPGKTKFDSIYSLEDPRIQSLLLKITNRGHEIGMHGSYYTYRDGNRILREKKHLMRVVEKVGIECDIKGNRQHYLRWSSQETPDHLEEAGFEYDTTGSYADSPGFRFGTSLPFTMWSWARRRALRIKQRPLIVMEGSVISYLGLGYISDSLDLMLKLKNRALRYGGDFVILWHNSHLTLDLDREFLIELLR